MNKRTLAIVATIGAVGAVAATAGARAPIDPVTEAFRLRMAGASDRSFQVLDTVLEADEANGPAWYEMARVRFYHLELEEASNAIGRAVSLEPENGHYHAFLGLTAAYRAVSRHHDGKIERVEDDLREAIAAYERAIELDPGLHDARLRLIELLVNLGPVEGGDRARAEELADALAGIAPTHEIQARCLLLDPRHESDCAILWQELLEREPAQAAAHAGLARAYLDADELERAEIEADAAILGDPALSAPLLAVGRAHAFGTGPDRAIAIFERFLEIEPAPPAPLRAHAQFLVAAVVKRRDRDRAEALLELARAIDPHVWTTMREPPPELFTEPGAAETPGGRSPAGIERRIESRPRR